MVANPLTGPLGDAPHCSKMTCVVPWYLLLGITSLTTTTALAQSSRPYIDTKGESALQMHQNI